ncbi:HNH endonuclease [Mesorhizobium sp. M2D.F.Ca.ET.185.01.1.1]|uniref:HNH endonuclease signature motif containing protein n=1 Tax=unclassified Mesorhizobium TaxID=325217 RepID=UPI000FCA3ECC|nr:MULTISPECIES: HNH endonuclease signature motif containing protein [unclassified Mesorhizobium]TGT97589.1 HNH endonuclease [bacterium M00.F.Ca.ET.163.01.1.1]TGU44654.1 HNH endonuclease [bacterium M00.F.Ca.ET.146.01.1.1]TGV68611.1 HNH endonuclease [Mesorhizobium sp. M00.F.Ca.ET.149.01.1.1]TGW09990.1 HNH endonuclease [Mesorhizobium sp. M2D.F.Ca.ET.145.01.1.1]TGP34047.1 HNH endonuclease [Mesorhizobium sp. M2D.F.Ca.ET.232.01.1.1]
MSDLEGIALSDIAPLIASRFWEKTIPEPMSGCLIWLGSANPGGYGNFWCEGRSRKAHRVAYAIEYGAIEAGVDVMHKCDNPACVNPRHLIAAPTAANIKDAFAKGRLHRRGDKNSKTIIPDNMVPIVLRLIECGVTTAQISHAFEVNQSTVRRIARGERSVA